MPVALRLQVLGLRAKRDGANNPLDLAKVRAFN
jgi:hypothetical protein